MAGAIKLAPAEIVAAALEGKTVMVGGNSGLTLERRRVNGESRLELSGFDPRSLPALKAKGCFTEIIQFRTRVFVPVSRAAEILGEISRKIVVSGKSVTVRVDLGGRDSIKKKRRHGK